MAVEAVMSSQVAGTEPAVMEQSSLRPGGKGSDLPTFPDVMGCCCCCAMGIGMVIVIGLWNLRRRGSMVTTGEKAMRLPTRPAANSGEIT